ncbi:MAG: hypothetical protein ACI9SP_003072 [Arenicella sp.]|jgi:hypothetical protein
MSDNKTIMHMNNFSSLFIVIALLCNQAFGHDIELKKFSSGLYKKNSFEYPASLTDKNLEIILKEIAIVTSYPIFYIRQNGDHLYSVVTCTKGESVEGKCKSGESYLFGQGEVAFSNFTITSSEIGFITPKSEDGDLIKPLKYSFGRYENVPFTYASTLSREQIELVIEKTLDLTRHEIMSVYPSRESFSKYTIMTCSTGARITFYCNGGRSYEFDFNTYKIKESGSWVQ